MMDILLSADPHTTLTLANCLSCHEADLFMRTIAKRLVGGMATAAEEGALRTIDRMAGAGDDLDIAFELQRAVGGRRHRQRTVPRLQRRRVLQRRLAGGDKT